MGGLGSGRRGGWGRNKIDEFQSLDVNELCREGCFVAGFTSRPPFERKGVSVGAIHIRAEQERIHLEYRIYSRGDNWRDVAEVVGLVRLPCQFGGERLYFICPGENGTNCGRRAGKLYRAGRLFLCRHCSNVTYISQCEDAGTRLRSKARKVLRRLDGDPSDWLSAQRPKGMWHRTFDRLERKAFDLEMEADEVFDARLVQIITRSRRA